MSDSDPRSGLGDEPVPFVDLELHTEELLALVRDRDVSVAYGDDEVVLTTPERAQGRGDATMALIRSLLEVTCGYETLLADALHNSLGWMAHLPEGDRRQCSIDLASALLEDRDDPSPTSQRFSYELAAWRSVAEIWAEPDLLERLRANLDTNDGGGDVTRPGGPPSSSPS